MPGKVVGANTRHTAVVLDRSDPLQRWRSEFRLPPNVIYLNGNSLGPPPKSASQALDDVRRVWQDDLGGAWVSAGWMDAPVRIGDKAGKLIGAAPGQAIVTDTTSVNLYKLLHAALAIRADRKQILIEQDIFPTDAYMAHEVGRQTSRRVRSSDRDRLAEDVSAHDAVVVVTHVDYKTGQINDIEAITKAAHSAGALVLADLSHSIGAVPAHLDEWGVDFAVACTYKYLNGGPGSPAVAYVSSALQAEVTSPLSGWMGHQAPMGFAATYEPAAGIRRFLAGTPPIIGYAPLEAAIDLALQVDMGAIREKSAALGELFVAEAERRLLEKGMRLVSPRDAARRGAHVAFAHPKARNLIDEIRRLGVIADHRPPDILRFGFGALYNRYTEVWDAVDRLAQVTSLVAG